MSASVHMARLSEEQLHKVDSDFRSRWGGLFDFLGVITPYNKDFVEELKASFGWRKWLSQSRLWVVEAEKAPALMQLVGRYFFGQLCVRCLEHVAKGDAKIQPICPVWTARLGSVVTSGERLTGGDVRVAVPVKHKSTGDRLVDLFLEYGERKE